MLFERNVKGYKKERLVNEKEEGMNTSSHMTTVGCLTFANFFISQHFSLSLFPPLFVSQSLIIPLYCAGLRG